ncbi:MAG TPA: hypothetical protein VF264_02450 [Rhodanobacteraceae bacterium]
MNTTKLLAIAGAIAINVAVLAGLHTVTATPVASVQPAPTVIHDRVTLPVIHVHPTAAQMRRLQRERATHAPEQASNGGGLACIDMPYYSFAAACSAAAVG